jgi:hypothetical protein
MVQGNVCIKYKALLWGVTCCSSVSSLGAASRGKQWKTESFGTRMQTHTHRTACILMRTCSRTRHALALAQAQALSLSERHKDTHTHTHTHAISWTHQLRSFGGAGADWLHFFLFESFPRNYRLLYQMAPNHCLIFFIRLGISKGCDLCSSLDMVWHTVLEQVKHLVLANVQAYKAI